MENVHLRAKSPGFGVNLTLEEPPPVVQPKEVGFVGVPTHRPGEQPTALLVRQQTDTVHPIQHRTFLALELDRTRQVGKIHSVGPAGWEVGPFDATLLTRPVNATVAVSQRP